MSVVGSNSISNTVAMTPGGAGVNQAFNAAALKRRHRLADGDRLLDRAAARDDRLVDPAGVRADDLGVRLGRRQGTHGGSRTQRRRSERRSNGRSRLPRRPRSNPARRTGAMSDQTETRRRRRWWRPALAILGILFAAFFYLVYRQVLAIQQKPSWPPTATAITSAGAQRATEHFAARSDPKPADVGMPYAWSTAATIEPWPEGKNFFPRIFADIEHAHSSVHILMFGWREGEIGTKLADLLVREDEAGRRGADHRRRPGKPGLRAGRADVHPARRRRSADRRQRPASRGTRTASTPTTARSTGARTTSATPTIASST